MSWLDQGRQEHGWFGVGTAPQIEDTSDVAANGTIGTGSLGQRVVALAYGALASLPPTLRRQAETQYHAGVLARLNSVVTAWVYGAKLDQRRFADVFFGRAPNDPVVTKLRGAILDAGTASNHDQMRLAATKLAEAMQEVGLDQWPRFLADAQLRARSPEAVRAVAESRVLLDSGQDAIEPVFPVEKTLFAIAATITGEAALAAAARAIGGQILKWAVPQPKWGSRPQTLENLSPTLPSATKDILFPNGKFIGVVNPGATQEIRTISPAEFTEIESRLLVGAMKVGKSNYRRAWYERADGSSFGVRDSARNGPTIDVNDSNLPSGFKVHSK